MGPTTHIFQDQLLLFRHFIVVNWLMQLRVNHIVSVSSNLVQVYKIL